MGIKITTALIWKNFWVDFADLVTRNLARPTMGYVHQVLTGNVNLPRIPFHKPVASYSTQNGIGFMDVITSSASNDGEC
jgi:hypothetical protein